MNRQVHGTVRTQLQMCSRYAILTSHLASVFPPKRELKGKIKLDAQVSETDRLDSEPAALSARSDRCRGPRQTVVKVHTAARAQHTQGRLPEGHPSGSFTGALFRELLADKRWIRSCQIV